MGKKIYYNIICSVCNLLIEEAHKKKDMCDKCYNLDYYNKNKEKINERARVFYNNNKLRERSLNEKWKKNNMELMRKYKIKYKQNLVKDGLCYECGNIRNKYKIYCDKCQSKNSDRRRKNKLDKRYDIFNCIDCGKDINNRGSSAKYCKDCYLIRKKESDRMGREKLKEIKKNNLIQIKEKVKCVRID